MADIYIIMGARGSGRREVLLDLLNQPEAAAENAPAALFLCDSEPPSACDENLAVLPHVHRHQWRWDEDEPVMPATEIVDRCANTFIILDGAANPVDQIEALCAWLQTTGHRIARVLTVVDCALLESSPGALPWYEACIHFSDVVLLNRREGVSNKWIKDYQEAFAKACFPCLFESVRKGRVANPARILYPEARRLSQIFDEEPEETVVESSAEDEDEEGEDEDPYLARKPGGFRRNPIPDIRDFLSRGDANAGGSPGAGPR